MSSELSYEVETPGESWELMLVPNPATVEVESHPGYLMASAGAISAGVGLTQVVTIWLDMELNATIIIYQ